MLSTFYKYRLKTTTSYSYKLEKTSTFYRMRLKSTTFYKFRLKKIPIFIDFLIKMGILHYQA